MEIIHVDMDAFFAAVEMRDDPTLAGKPVIIGSMPGERGVAATCNYEARKYGVRSASPLARLTSVAPMGCICAPIWPSTPKYPNRYTRYGIPIQISASISP